MFPVSVPWWGELIAVLVIAAVLAAVAVRVWRGRGRQPWWRAGRVGEGTTREAEPGVKRHRRREWE